MTVYRKWLYHERGQRIQNEKKEKILHPSPFKIRKRLVVNGLRIIGVNIPCDARTEEGLFAYVCGNDVSRAAFWLSVVENVIAGEKTLAVS